MKHIVISAVNFTSGGPLSILIDCLKSIENLKLYFDYEIIVLVHKKELVADFTFCTIYEHPHIKSSWLNRLYFEFIQSKKIAKELKADLWIALHDITPSISCPQVVYCHNPSPFYKIKKDKILYDVTFTLFCIFYKYLYQINIKKNMYVIVQQQWMREEFEKKYNVKCVVAYPSLQTTNHQTQNLEYRQTDKPFVFFYPAFARVAKNFEVLLEASLLLSKKRKDFEVWLTIDQSLNKYAKKLFDTYKNIEQIKFLGLVSRVEVFKLYEQSNCLVFSSELETWGLPITEYKYYQKPILLADLKYAHETAGNYNLLKYFNPKCPEDLATYMNALIDGQLSFDTSVEILPGEPFCKNWDDLIKLLFAII